jgi:hypothetical protein
MGDGGKKTEQGRPYTEVGPLGNGTGGEMGDHGLLLLREIRVGHRSRSRHELRSRLSTLILRWMFIPKRLSGIRR